MKDDTISRQAAIDAVKKNTFRLTFAEEQNCEGHVAWSAEAVYSDVMEGALLDLPSAQSEQRWITCSKRLPEGITQVIIQTNGEAIHEAIYMGKDDYGHYVWKRPDNEIYWDEEVVAWMPLPTPYQPKEDES